MTGTHAIITKDAVTGEVKTGNVEVSLYVPNLVEGLGNVGVLFYDNATGKLLKPGTTFLAQTPVPAGIRLEIAYQ